MNSARAKCPKVLRKTKHLGLWFGKRRCVLRSARRRRKPSFESERTVVAEVKAEIGKDGSTPLGSKNYAKARLKNRDLFGLHVKAVEDLSADIG